VNITDLHDPIAVDAYLLRIGRDVAVDDAEALAEDALGFSDAPAGAWTVLAHVAEHRGDLAGFERWTAAALDVDGHFDPALDDHDYLDALRDPGTRKAGAALRADRLLLKVQAFANRVANLRHSIDLAAQVLEVDESDLTYESCDIAESLLFTGFLVFDAGLLHHFARVVGPVLPPAEQALAQQWIDAGVRHRHVRMVEQSRRRWRLAEVATGELLVADTLIETWWAAEREGFVLLAPVGSKLVVVGEPMVFPPAQRAEARAAVASVGSKDPLAVARTALRWRFDRERAARFRFCFPDVDPSDVPVDEEALLAFVAHRMPDAEEYDHLLEAITAHRVLTRRTPHTWDLAATLLGAGGTRDAVWHATKAMTARELWARAQEEAA